VQGPLHTFRFDRAKRESHNWPDLLTWTRFTAESRSLRDDFQGRPGLIEAHTWSTIQREVRGIRVAPGSSSLSIAEPISSRRVYTLETWPRVREHLPCLLYGRSASELGGVDTCEGSKAAAGSDVGLSDFSTFCFQASLALLIALLAWGDQIRQPRKVVTQVEQRFLEKLGKPRADLNPIIHESFDPSIGKLKYTFSQIVGAIVSLAVENKLDEHNADVLNQLRGLDTTRASLESMYEFRYFLTILLTIVFGVAGVFAVYNGGDAVGTVMNVQITLVSIYAIPILGVFLSVIANLITVYSAEGNFVRKIEKADESI
jgi:hypothetical protein